MLCCFVIALRIHISEATKGILDDLGGFEVEERGEVFLKVCNVYRRCFFFFHSPTRTENANKRFTQKQT